MSRFMVWMLALGMLWASAANRAAAEASKIATSMGDLRWGLSENEVISYARRKLEDVYDAQIQKTKDSAKKGQLRADLKRAQADVAKSKFTFSGNSSKWDRTPIAGEFDYDNDESMLSSKEPDAENYYFFVNSRLWKWVRVMDKSAAGGDFKKFTSAIEGKFGKGRAKKGEIAKGQGDTQYVEYFDCNSRLRAADVAKHGAFSLIYEEMATVRELASLRGPSTKPGRLAGADDETDAREAQAKAQKEQEQVAKANTKKSIFGNDRQQETEADFQARRQKEASDQRNRQVRMHERKEDAKKGEVLKQLDGINDSDPLGGL
jgi:hypothetical protein